MSIEDNQEWYYNSWLIYVFSSDYILKFIIFGDAGVGKTCLLVRYTDDTFISNYISTIGVDMVLKVISIIL